MDRLAIKKPRGTWVTVPHLVDYEATRLSFSWEQAAGELDGLPGGQGLNIAHEAVVRHAAGARRGHLAIRWLGRHGDVHDLSYGDLDLLSNRFANVLRGLGVGPGECVFALASLDDCVSYVQASLAAGGPAAAT